MRQQDYIINAESAFIRTSNFKMARNYKSGDSSLSPLRNSPEVKPYLSLSSTAMTFTSRANVVFQPKLVNTSIVVLSNNDGRIVSRSSEVKR